jgi:hypothetical protein
MKRLFGKAKRASSSESSRGSVNGNGSEKGNGSFYKGKVSADGKTTTFRVSVPPNVIPGQEFQVYAGNKIVRVKCPANSLPGQFLQITVPTDPEMPSPSQAPNLPPDSDNVTRVEDNGEGGDPAYMVTIPEGIRGDQPFPVTIAGQQLMVTCPTNALPGHKVRIVPPPPPPPERRPTDQNGSNNNNLRRPSSREDYDDEQTQLFEVLVPQGVVSGRSFALLAGGVRVLVTCPTNAGPGQRIRFKLPIALTQKREPQSEAAAIKLSYDKDGWTRTIRVSDMKFQWVRMDDVGNVDTNTRFNAEKSAYVRKLVFTPGVDERVRDGVLSLVPATEAFVDSRVKGNNGEVLVMYSEIADAQVKAYEVKADWFQEKCKLLRVEWNEGHMRINVRRSNLVEDSVDAVMSLNRKDLRKVWRFEFIGEMGIDAGGLAREWFELVTQDIFDPDMGLWESSEANQMCMGINPASSKSGACGFERRFPLFWITCFLFRCLALSFLIFAYQLTSMKTTWCITVSLDV